MFDAPFETMGPDPSGRGSLRLGESARKMWLQLATLDGGNLDGGNLDGGTLDGGRLLHLHHFRDLHLGLRLRSWQGFEHRRRADLSPLSHPWLLFLLHDDCSS